MGNTVSDWFGSTRQGDASNTNRAITDYNIWFRHDAEPEIEDIPEDMEEKMKRYSREELVRSTEGLTLTHMIIRGEIPPLLHRIAPNLTHLRLRDMISVDQLERIKHLKKLEMLDVSWNKINKLPSWIVGLSNLRELRVRSCGLTSLPDSMKQLVQLEKLDLSQNEMKTLPSVIAQLHNLRELDVSECSLTSLPDSVRRLDKLQTLLISGNKINVLPIWISELSYLSWLAVRYCGLSSLPDSVRRLDKLQRLDISNNNINVLPIWISDLSDLIRLDVRSCGLSSLPDSVRRLDKLQYLDISQNKINVLPIWISELSYLSWLDVVECGLSSLPYSVRRLDKLQYLDISYNKINVLPIWISELSELGYLHVSRCGLSSLPDSVRRLDKLQDLDISGNKINVLPIWISELSALRVLDVILCGLSSLPDSVRQLDKLQTLSISGNKINVLPIWISELSDLSRLGVRDCGLSSLPDSLEKLKKLEVLWLGNNNTLTSIPQSIISIRSLKDLYCYGCDSLTSPPYAVAKQGLDAIRQYIEALKQEKGNNKRTFVVTVIGKSQAGKTSLVKSIQQSKRVLTERSEESKLDQATRVFNTAEVKVSDDDTILFFDCGGHDIYHVAYQMTFRTECVLKLVIDIADFDRMASSKGLEVACKEVCMDWLSQLYPSCPKLGRPIVVLTHCDQLTPAKVNQRKEELIRTTEILRKRIVDEENNEAGREMNPVFTMTAFCDMLQPLIASDRVYMFSNTTSETQIRKLREELTRLGALISTEIPGSWYAMLLYINKQQEKVCISLSDIDNKFPADTKHYILQYIHDIGKVMWFRNHPSLQKYIFHRADVVTHMIEVLFHHAEEHAWKSRIESFLPFDYEAGQRIQERMFVELINNFLRTGIMDAALLSYLLTQDSPFPSNLAIDILKAFKLICGPIQDKVSNRSVYILPFSSRDEIVVSEDESCTRLEADILLNGLPVPVYVYSQATASFIDLHMSPFNHIQSGMNGARVKENTNKLTKCLLHNSRKSCLTLITTTPAGSIAEAWRSQLSTIRKLVTELKSVWKGVRYEVVFYCSHCLATNNSDPTTIVDPAWCHTDGVLTSHSYTGLENFICVNGSKEDTVPSPLMFPCQSVSQDGVRRLEDYLQSLSIQDTAGVGIPVVASHPVTQPTGGVENEQRCLDQILMMMKSAPALLDLNPDGGAASNNNQAVYEVTETRGRALIISNDYNGTRPGSKAAYENIRLMLSKFGFVTAGGHGNFTAKGIIEAIHRETQITDGSGESVHKKLGTFVLVLTSHGGKGSIIGCDGVHIELTDIYNLLSPYNFPAMKGKPKMIIIQACAGALREMLLGGQPQPVSPPTPANPRATDGYLQMSIDETDSVPQDISVSDLIIMQASFDSFVSARSKTKGSPFIRAVVLVFYRLAHKYHVQQLAEMVQHCVMKHGTEGSTAQVPKTVCTFTDLRKLYLRPDARTDDHPQEVTNPVYPDHTTTAIIPGPRRLMMEDKGGNDIKTTEYYEWRVVDNSRRVRPTPAS